MPDSPGSCRPGWRTESGFQEEAGELMTAEVFKPSIDGAAGRGPRPGGGAQVSPWNLALLRLTVVMRVQIRG